MHLGPLPEVFDKGRYIFFINFVIKAFLWFMYIRLPAKVSGTTDSGPATRSIDSTPSHHSPKSVPSALYQPPSLSCRSGEAFGGRSRQGQQSQ